MRVDSDSTAISHAMSARFDTHHGMGNGIAISRVWEHNVSANYPKFARMAEAMGYDTRGLTDVAALIGIAGANIAMILFGWIMEMVNRPGEQVWWSPFWFGCIAGIAPWVAIAAYITINVAQEGGQGPPGFVYGIIVSIFLFFNSFAINQWLQYRQVGRWRDYLFGETVYIVLSLTAKTILAWQIFANTLIE